MPGIVCDPQETSGTVRYASDSRLACRKPMIHFGRVGRLPILASVAAGERAPCTVHREKTYQRQRAKVSHEADPNRG